MIVGDIHADGNANHGGDCNGPDTRSVLANRTHQKT